MSRRGSSVAPAPSFAVARDPALTDDTSTGAVSGSLQQNTVRETHSICADPSAGAAVWIPTGVPRPKMIPGKYYALYTGIHNTGTLVPTSGRLYLTPFVLTEKVTVGGFAANVFTAGVASSAKIAVWSDKDGRPSGLPILAVNAGITTNAAGDAIWNVSKVLHPGVYWIGIVCTGTTLPAFNSISSTDYSMQQLIGRSSMGTTAITALYIDQPYANDLAALNLTNATLLDFYSNGVPIMNIGAV